MQFYIIAVCMSVLITFLLILTLSSRKKSIDKATLSAISVSSIISGITFPFILSFILQMIDNGGIENFSMRGIAISILITIVIYSVLNFILSMIISSIITSKLVSNEILDEENIEIASIEDLYKHEYSETKNETRMELQNNINTINENESDELSNEFIIDSETEKFDFEKFVDTDKITDKMGIEMQNDELLEAAFAKKSLGNLQESIDLNIKALKLELDSYKAGMILLEICSSFKDLGKDTEAFMLLHEMENSSNIDLEFINTIKANL